MRAVRLLRSVVAVVIGVVGFGGLWIAGPALGRLPLLVQGLILLGLIGACTLAWVLIARPHLIREGRREKGLCVSCGYDPRGNVSDVCPECGRSERDNELVDDCP
jgi:hypothetical protein